MGLLLNRFLITLALLMFIGQPVFSQEKGVRDEISDREKDYKDKNEFKKFQKYRNQVSAWQIQNLKFGAIIVRLQNNERKLNALKQVNNIDLYCNTLAETQFINRLIYRQFSTLISFCKVYFIYSQSSEALLDGKRDGIFLDSTLQVDNNIKLTENYYLLMDEDYVYNSSIGFVREDSARKIIESGNPTTKKYLVLKNKYGHQLKKPFPYVICQFDFPSLIVNSSVVKNFNKRVEYKETVYGFDAKTRIITLAPRKSWLSDFENYIIGYNYKLKQFYNSNSDSNISDPEVKPFLY